MRGPSQGKLLKICRWEEKRQHCRRNAECPVLKVRDLTWMDGEPMSWMILLVRSTREVKSGSSYWNLLP